MRTAGTLVLLSLLTLGCDGKSAVPAFGVVALVDEPQRGPAGPKGAKGDPGPQGPQGEPGERDSIDGSRLRARYIEGADGSRQPLGDWLDSETGLPCSYAKAADGELRCLPGEIPQSVVRFLDDSCSTLVLLVEAGAAPPPLYGTTFVAPVDPGKPVYVHVGTGLTTPSAVYSVVADGTCVTVAGNLSDYDFYSIQESLPLDFFVSGVIESD